MLQSFIAILEQEQTTSFLPQDARVSNPLTQSSLQSHSVRAPDEAQTYFPLCITNPQIFTPHFNITHPSEHTPAVNLLLKCSLGTDSKVSSLIKDLSKPKFSRPRLQKYPAAGFRGGDADSSQSNLCKDKKGHQRRTTVNRGQKHALQ